MATKENRIVSATFAMARMEYCLQQNHRSHIGKVLSGPNLLHAKDPAEFISRGWALYEAYMRERRRRPGRKPEYFMSEIIYRCPKGTWLTEWEKQKIISEILEAVGGDCPSCHYWHEHDDGTADFHLFVLNCSPSSGTLRKAAYGNGNANYWRVLHDAENRAISVINAKRRQVGKTEIESVPEAKARLAQGKGIRYIHHELAELEVDITEKNICEQLLRLGHSGEISGWQLKMTFNGVPHPRPYDLQKLVTLVNKQRRHLEHPFSDHLEPERVTRITSMNR